MLIFKAVIDLSPVCFFRTDIQTALYELCWQVVLGNLKLDLVASVLGDMMVAKLPTFPLFPQSLSKAELLLLPGTQTSALFLGTSRRHAVNFSRCLQHTRYVSDIPY